jgi:hypothetical protein
LRRKDEVIAEIMEDLVRTKKQFGESSKASPTQGVRGKGLWELQSRGIDVELFPPELAKRIRALNHKFIRIQQTLGIQITSLESAYHWERANLQHFR